MACDVDHIPVTNSKRSERLGSDGMQLVRELLKLINGKSLDRVIVAMNFTFRWVLPCKERAYPGYEFQGDTNETREVPEEIDRDEIKCRILILFNLASRLFIRDQQRAFSVGNLPLVVRVFCNVYS